MASESIQVAAPSALPVTHVKAGLLPDWTVGDLPDPPPRGWRTWARLLGPGVLLAGASVGSGEWLFGPAVSAQYGATLLWLAGLSIVAQVFCNLEMMRYAVYCGESIIVGYLRTWPGPRFWMVWFVILDLAAIWPFNASNAAVPLAAAMLGHLPGRGVVDLLGYEMPEWQLVKVLGYVIFLVAFVPLIFGGTIYRMLERVMATKLVLVLGFLVFFTLFTVSASNMWEVVTGFFRVGTVPLRAETIIVGRHFTLTRHEGPERLTIKGTIEHDAPLVTAYLVTRGGAADLQVTKFDRLESVPAALAVPFGELTTEAVALAQPGRFTVADTQLGRRIAVEGRIDEARKWQPERYTITAEDGQSQVYQELSAVPEPYRARLGEYLQTQGLELVGLVDYTREHGALPPLDWAMLASLAAIAGAGGLTNTLFSNFARDAGWGMGARVGTIPSAIGARQIQLSHVGEAFRLNATNRARWLGWMRHIRRDQLYIWMLASVIGMALPCMLSLEFIRHAPVSGDRVAAMTAEGMAERYPQFSTLLWTATLLCGFLVLAPGQILSADQIARRWTDIIWTSNSRAQRMSGDKVRWIYYSILTMYGCWGLVALTLFDPLQIAKIAAVLMNIALGWSSIHVVYVNRMLLPKELQSSLLMQLGALACGVFFITVSMIVLVAV